MGGSGEAPSEFLELSYKRIAQEADFHVQLGKNSPGDMLCVLSCPKATDQIPTVSPHKTLKQLFAHQSSPKDSFLHWLANVSS